MLAKAVTVVPMVLPRGAYFKTIRRPITELSVVMQVDNESCWIDPLIDFLESGKLQANRKEAHKVKNQASKYLVHEGKLYKRSFFLPVMCL